MTTRREFIKILTGVIVAISLPVGLFSGKKEEVVKTGTASYFKYEKEVEFTLVGIEVVPATFDFHWFVRGLGIPKDKRIPPAYFAVRIEDIDNYDKEAVLKEIKDSLSEHFKNRRVI